MQGVVLSDLNGRTILCYPPHAHTSLEDSPSRLVSEGQLDQVTVSLVRDSVTLSAVCARSLPPTVPTTFLQRVHALLLHYLPSSTVTPAAIKDSFDLVLAILAECLATPGTASTSNAYPRLTEFSEMKELVLPPAQFLERVLSAIPGEPTRAPALSLLASPLPWRRTGIKYSSNEFYLDLVETYSSVISCILSTKKKGKGIVLRTSIDGTMECKTRLTGMPDLELAFASGAGLNNRHGGANNTMEGPSCSFHKCVRFARWDKEGVVSFVPPDGHFELMNYSVPPPTHILPPLTITPSFALTPAGSVGFAVSLTSSFPFSSPVRNIVVSFLLPAGIASGTNCTVTGGPAFATSSSGTAGSRGGLAGDKLPTSKSSKERPMRWEMVDVEEAGASEAGKVQQQRLEWRILQLSSADREAVMTGSFPMPTEATSLPPIVLSVTFDTEQAFSGTRIGGVKMTSAGAQGTYSFYKGVKVRGKGSVEVRCR